MTVFYVLSSLVLLWLLGNLLTYPLQKHFIMFPESLPENYQYHFEADFEELFIESLGGGRLNALWFKAKQSKGVVLYFHGNADNLSRWGELHREFLRRGYDLMIFDYRGFGKSTGSVNEKLFYQDATALYLVAREYFAPKDIIIYGRSLGSGPASWLASRHQVKHLILETPFSSLDDLFHTYYPFLPKMFLFKYRFPVKDHLKGISIPVTIFHGTEDRIVPMPCTRMLEPYLKPDDKFIVVEGADHNNVSSSETYKQHISLILE